MFDCAWVTITDTNYTPNVRFSFYFSVRQHKDGQSLYVIHHNEVYGLRYVILCEYVLYFIFLGEIEAIYCNYHVHTQLATVSDARWLVFFL